MEETHWQLRGYRWAHLIMKSSFEWESRVCSKNQSRHILIWSNDMTFEAYSSLLVCWLTCLTLSVQDVSGFAIKKKLSGCMVHHLCGGLMTHLPSVEPAASLKTRKDNMVRNKQARCKEYFHLTLSMRLESKSCQRNVHWWDDLHRSGNTELRDVFKGQNGRNEEKKTPKKHNQLIPAVCLDLTEQCVFRAWTGTVQCWDIVRGTAYIAHTIYCKRTTWAFHFSSYCSFSAQHCIISADINIKYRYNNNLYPLEELRLTLPNNPAEDEQQNVQV